MAVEITFPRVDMDMTSGRVGLWHVQEGQPVRKGDPLFEIETDKAAMEIEAPASGVVRGITAAAGDTVEVGLGIGWIVPEGEDWTEPAAAAATAAAEPVGQPAADRTIALADEPTPGRDTGAARSLRATPLARREARRSGIALEDVRGSGPRGRVMLRDLPDVAADRFRHGDAPGTGDIRVEPTAPLPPPRTPAARAVDVDGIHRRWLGRADGQPVVFLHGFGGDQRSWRPVWAHLAAHHRILALDLPGHGGSANSGPVSLDGLVETVAAVLRAEGVERPHLVGHSLGGAVALGLVDTDAFDVRSLCLIAPAGLGPEIDGAFVAGMVSATREASLRPWLTRLFADPGAVSAAFVSSALDALSRDGVRDYRAALAGCLFADGTQTIDLRQILARLTVPAKILWGRQDRIIPLRHASMLPGHVALHTLDSGHMPQIEEASVVAALIAEVARAATG